MFNIIFKRLLVSIARWSIISSTIIASLLFSRKWRNLSDRTYWLFDQYYLWFNIWYFASFLLLIVSVIWSYLYEYKRYKLSVALRYIDTWFEDLIYPIIWLWAPKWVPIVVKSFEQYKDEYLFLQWWLHVTTIIDSSLKQYKVWSKESLVDIWKEILHEYIYDWVDVDLDYIKNIILENKQYINKYYHDWILERIKSTTSFVTLVNAIDYYPLP